MTAIVLSCMGVTGGTVRQIDLGRMTGMTVMMMIAMAGIAGVDRSRHAVLAKWHGHGRIALQWEPQRNHYAEKGSPAIHAISISYVGRMFQTSEPDRGRKFPCPAMAMQIPGGAF